MTSIKPLKYSGFYFYRQVFTVRSLEFCPQGVCVPCDIAVSSS